MLLSLFVCLLAVAGDLSKGFEHFYNLEYDEAEAIFTAEAARTPEDPDAHNHVAQAILYREMLRAGALESELVSGSDPFIGRERVRTSPETEKAFFARITRTMELCQARIAKNPKDARALYSLGVAHGLRANYLFLVRKAWLDSLRDATAARKAHNQVVALEPANIDARLLQGLHDYIVGSLPWHMKVLGFVAGFRGDREAGIRTLQLVAEKGSANKYDAQVMLAAIYRRDRKPLQALPLVEKLADRFPRNYLLRLEAGQMYSDAGDKDKALAAFATAERLKRSGAPGYASLPIEKIWFYRGVMLFWYREYPTAIEELRRVTPHAATLDVNTAVTAWLRLGQSLDMSGRRKEAQAAYREATRISPESQPGKEAKQYLSSPYRRRDDA